MKESAVSEKKAGSVSAKRAKEAASLTRDGLKVADRPLMNIVRRAGCTDCRPSVQSLAGGIMQTPVAQRQAAAMSLQMARGNRFMQGMAVQAKLMVGSADDEHEIEADRVAEQVMSMPVPATLGKMDRAQRGCQECKERLQRQLEEQEEEEKVHTEPIAEQNIPLVQWHAKPEEGEVERVLAKQDEKVQQKDVPEEDVEIVQSKELVGGACRVSPGVEARIRSMSGSGQPLSQSERGFFEPRFGRDFSRVRVHTDACANETAKMLNSRAYTLGNNIVFAGGQFSPSSAEGKKLLAHELVHVVAQQSAYNDPFSIRRAADMVTIAGAIGAIGTAASVGSLAYSMMLGKIRCECAEWMLSQIGGDVVSEVSAKTHKEIPSVEYKYINIANWPHDFTSNLNIIYSIRRSWKDGVMNVEVRPVSGSSSSDFDSGEVEIVNKTPGHYKEQDFGRRLPYVEFEIRAHIDPYGWVEWWQSLNFKVDTKDISLSKETEKKRSKPQFIPKETK
jgi:hypothetical protein